MQQIIKYILLALILVVSTSGFSQIKKIDKLEQLFDQGLYAKVERKASTYLAGEFKGHPSPMLFHALSEYYLGDTRKYNKSQGVLEFEEFLKSDSNQRFQKMYSNYINDFHDALVNEIRELKESGKTKQAEIRYATLQRLFSGNASFDEMVDDEPEIIANPSTETTVKENKDNPNIAVATNSSAPSSNVSESTIRENVVDEAKKHLGTPYKYGGTTAGGFDCSGYTQYVMAKNNVSIPRTSTAQATSYQKIKTSEAQPGDLVFFGSSKNKISHVGIVTSNPGESLTMIHASTSRGVMISEINKDPYWSARLLYVVRVINDTAKKEK